MSKVGEELPILARETENPIIDPYRLMSLPATLRHEDDRLIEALRWHLLPFAIGERQRDSYDLEIVETREDRPGYPWRLTYLRGGLQLFRGSPAPVLDYALWDIHSLVHGHCMDFLFLHAGVVSSGERRLILPASPDAGKSTLVASLLREGLQYLSDELAPIDPVTSNVYPFPKHIAIANSGLDHVGGGPPDLPADYPALTAELDSRYLRPADLSSGVAEPGPVDMIVFLTADRDGQPQLHPLSSAETLALLLDHSLNTELYGERAMTMLARVINGAESFELTGGSSAERASLLRAHL